MNKYIQLIGSRILDAAPEPAVIRVFSIPAILGAVVIVLIAVTLVLIKRARAKNRKPPEDRGSYGETK